MTTAKPQPQTSDDTDDLIAQLAQLMASDSTGGTVEAPEPELSAQPVERPFSIRLPGDAAPHQETRSSAPARPAEPQAPSRPPLSSYDPVEPFQFEVGTPRESGTSNPAASAADDDLIGDLIAAELSRAAPTEPETGLPEVGNDEVPEDAPVLPAAAVAAPAVKPAPESPDVGTDEPAPLPQAQQDDFRIAPVFGLAGPVPPRPQPVAPPVVQTQPSQPKAQDPIAEIEQLIGAAVKVRLDDGRKDPVVEVTTPHAGTAAAEAEPVVAPKPEMRRSLATPQPLNASVQAEPARSEKQIGTAEDAILAAAAATGADVGWIDQSDQDLPDAEDDPMPVVRRRGFRMDNLRPFLGPSVAVLFLVTAGVGLYSVLGSAGGASSPPPVLQADTTPVREVPVREPQATAATQSVVFSEMAGQADQAPVDEALVSRDQSEETDVAALAAGDISAEGLVNRKVRTVTVRPDGTIVGGDAALAGASLLPVDRPDVPEVPGASTEAPELIAAANAATGATDLADTALGFAASAQATPPVAPEEAPAALLVPGQVAEAIDASGNIIAGRTVPVPMARLQRPASAPTSAPVETASVSTALDAAPAAPAPVTTASVAPASAAAASNAPAYVQLSSQRTPEAAEATRQDLSSRFGSLFGGTALEVQRVDLGDRGIYYRVRLPANSLASANAICNSVKSNGGDCFTL